MPGSELTPRPSAAAGPAPCPSDDILAAHFASELSADEAFGVAAHMDSCDTCRELAVAFQRGMRTEPDVLGSAARSAEGSRPSASGSIELTPPSLPGAFAGRYQLKRLIGTGGMGAVYEALDLSLQRLIALKVLRLPPDNPAERTEAANRLVREARAMAKLSHRNVVAVYDVGIHNEQVFVAMQLVDGTTLRQWRVAQPRSPRQILRLLVEAGTGLAAAHAGGLVHRDFKPDNILISKRGTPRVTDFGLARRADFHFETSSVADRLSRPKMVDVELPPTVTRTGAVVGTPAYMAPEQAQGQACDARADQFSFCVTAWEALWGMRPFAGTTWSEIYANVVSGKITPPPMRPHVPWGVRRALERGMSVDPSERWPSMTHLLDMLEDAIRRPSRRRFYAIVSVTAVAASAVAILAWSQGIEPLRRAEPAATPGKEVTASPIAVEAKAPAPTSTPATSPEPANLWWRLPQPSADPGPASDSLLAKLTTGRRGLDSEARRRGLLRADLPPAYRTAVRALDAALAASNAEAASVELERAREVIGGVAIDRAFVDAKNFRLAEAVARLPEDRQAELTPMLADAAALADANDLVAANKRLNVIAAKLGR